MDALYLTSANVIYACAFSHITASFIPTRINQLGTPLPISHELLKAARREGLTWI
jgi:hypothetical protein